MTEEMPKVFVVDDDESVRQSLESLLRSTGLTVFTFSSAAEFLAEKPAAKLGCLILDVKLPDLNGLELQQQMAEIGIELPIIFITGHGTIPMSVRAMKAGALEFLTKPFQAQELLEAVEAAIEECRNNQSEKAEIRQIRRRYDTLSPREKQIMALVVSGMLNKQIAGKLDISEITVKVHRAQVMQKMKADSLAALVKMSGKL